MHTSRIGIVCGGGVAKLGFARRARQDPVHRLGTDGHLCRVPPAIQVTENYLRSLGKLGHSSTAITMDFYVEDEATGDLMMPDVLEDAEPESEQEQ